MTPRLVAQSLAEDEVIKKSTVGQTSDVMLHGLSKLGSLVRNGTALVQTQIHHTFKTKAAGTATGEVPRHVNYLVKYDFHYPGHR